ncbi:unnamed protein product [Gadus morhua 'NCC']
MPPSKLTDGGGGGGGVEKQRRKRGEGPLFSVPPSTTSGGGGGGGTLCSPPPSTPSVESEGRVGGSEKKEGKEESVCGGGFVCGLLGVRVYVWVYVCVCVGVWVLCPRKRENMFVLNGGLCSYLRGMLASGSSLCLLKMLFTLSVCPETLKL